MAKNASGKNLIIFGITSLCFNASIGTSISYFLGFHPLGGFLAANLFCHIPLSLAASDAFRQELGLKSPIDIAGSWAGRPGRKIKINAGDKSKNIFMKMLPAPAQPKQIKDVWQLETILVTMDGQSYQVPLSKVEEFIYGAYSRQRQGKYGLSRRYWIQERTVCLNPQGYKLMMTILENVPGLIINRDERKSGYLAISPKKAIELIQSAF